MDTNNINLNINQIEYLRNHNISDLRTETHVITWINPKHFIIYKWDSSCNETLSEVFRSANSQEVHDYIKMVNGITTKKTRVIKHSLKETNLVNDKIKELKDFCKQKNHAVSWTFSLKARDYGVIAKQLPYHFKDIRITVKEKNQMPSIYQKDPYQGKWVILTISKS